MKMQRKVQLLKLNINCVRLILHKSAWGGTERHRLCTRGGGTGIPGAAGENHHLIGTDAEHGDKYKLAVPENENK